jgi:hypothetical protein
MTVKPPLVEHRQAADAITTWPRRRQRRRRTRGTHVVKTLWPPQSGTIKLSRRYGPALLCVRYRHDEAGLRRYTTVELIVDEAPVTGTVVDRRLFAVKVGRLENELRAAVKACGAQWNNTEELWVMRGSVVKKLGLERRVRKRWPG